MRSWTRGWWCTLVVAVFMTTTAGAQVVLETSPGATGATRVRAWVQGPELQLADARTGEPVAAPDVAERATSSGGRLLWVVESDSVDELGMRHVILRQRLRPAPGSVTLPGGLMRDGVPLHGSLVGLHYDPEGTLKVVGASMFEDVAVVGDLALPTPDHVYAAAASGVAQREGRRVAALSELPPEVVAASRLHAQLELFSRGDGRSFDYVWTVPMSFADGGVVTARVHGASGDVLGAWNDVAPFGIGGRVPKTIVGPPCYFEGISSSDDVAAGVIRQHEMLEGDDRVPWPRGAGARATPSPGLEAYYAGQGITHHAITAAEGFHPEIRVYSGWYLTTTTYQCVLSGYGRQLRLVPLKAAGGQPTFDDLRDIDGPVDIAGRAAGDAYFNARKTFEKLAGLGWTGYTGLALDLVVHSSLCSGQENAFFAKAPFNLYGGVAMTDRDAVHFCDLTGQSAEPPFVSSSRFSFSAALDVVAHEIGHGLIYQLTPWVRDAFDGDVSWGDVMHEGWADVIGLIVEWAAEGSQGDGMSLDPDEFDRVEHADWFAGEDTFRSVGAQWDRRWDDHDDGANVGYSLHNADTPGDPTPPLTENAYYTSNRLPLAFRLSITGGRNPVCSRSADVRRYWTGCEVGLFSPQFCAEHPYFCPPEPGAPPGSLGSDFSVVGRPVAEMSEAFFRALHVYWMYMDDWDSVADFVKVAAHDLFRSLPGGWPPPVCDDAFAQQIAVAGAFRSVGYEGSGGWVCMCENPCSPPVEW